MQTKTASTTATLSAVHRDKYLQCEPLPELRAGNSTELLKELKRVGLNPDEVFVKTRLQYRPQHPIYPYMVNIFEDTVNHYAGLGTHDIRKELELLRKLHSVVPENIVQPLATVRNNGLMAGYVMEHLGHYNQLSTYLEESYVRPYNESRIPQTVLDTLKAAVQKLHKYSLVHGDLHAKNIFFKGDSVKIIDPLYGGTSNVDASYLTALGIYL